MEGVLSIGGGNDFKRNEREHLISDRVGKLGVRLEQHCM